jgi:hypothetical protein
MGKVVIDLVAIVVIINALFAHNAEAQHTVKAARIGILGGMAAITFADRLEVFRQQRRELGYLEGKNIVLEARWADDKMDRLGELAIELVGRKVDVLVTFGGTAPVAAATESEGRALGLKFQSLKVTKAGDFDNVFEAAKKERAGAMLVTANPLIFTHLGRIAELAAKNRLPTIHPQREFVEAGGFMMYGPSEAEIYRRAAIYVDKILKGAKPAELPVERPTKFQLIFNLQTAKRISLTIPPNVLARADRVIR